ncbi:hypothetical protein LTR10_003774 [Elasticomyces elasticus]|nr:hypothetical protein LTR10_003774 [Elasticomyces elasticus]
MTHRHKRRRMEQPRQREHGQPNGDDQIVSFAAFNECKEPHVHVNDEELADAIEEAKVFLGAINTMPDALEPSRPTPGVPHARAIRGEDNLIQKPAYSRPSTPDLLGLPSEVRNEIYHMVFGDTFTDNTQHIVSSRNDCESSEEARKRKWECYEVLRTCKRIYNEASPILWGQRCVYLHAEPASFAPNAVNPYDLSKLGGWTTRSGIKNRKLRRKVRALDVAAWHPSPWATTLSNCRKDWWRADCADDPSVAGLDGLENVRTLRIVLLPLVESQWSTYPSHEEAMSLIDRLHPDFQVAPLRMLAIVDTFKNSTETTLKYLLSCGKLPNVNTVHIVGWSNPAEHGLTWYGATLQTLGPSNEFVARLKSVARTYGCRTTIDMADVPTEGQFCNVCKKQWSPGHWTPSNPEGQCPDKHNDEFAQDADHCCGPEDATSEWSILPPHPDV